MLEIKTVPDPILRQKAQRVRGIGGEVQKLIDEMRLTLTNSPRKGIGLAAPQVGQSLRIILARAGRAEAATTLVLVNPEIIKSSSGKESAYEGCLSIPNVWGQVERSVKVVVKARNRTGKNITLKASNLLARVLQHEIDHLDGILITDKIVGKILTEEEYHKLSERETTQST